MYILYVPNKNKTKKNTQKNKKNRKKQKKKHLCMTNKKFNHQDLEVSLLTLTFLGQKINYKVVIRNLFLYGKLSIKINIY